jgi:hypothetical protein
MEPTAHDTQNIALGKGGGVWIKVELDLQSQLTDLFGEGPDGVGETVRFKSARAENGNLYVPISLFRQVPHPFSVRRNLRLFRADFALKAMVY